MAPWSGPRLNPNQELNVNHEKPDPLSKRAKTLMSSALPRHLRSLTPSQVAIDTFDGGHSRARVARVSTLLDFVVKTDATSTAAARQGARLQRERIDERLPLDYRLRLPEVWACDGEGYAFEALLPEAGWATLADRSWPLDGGLPTPAAEAREQLEAALGPLGAAHDATVNPRLRPDIGQLTLRIEQRLSDAAAIDERFFPRGLTINGRRHAGWVESVALIRQRAPLVRAFEAPFSTHVHGDFHPGNIFVRVASAKSYEARYIDPGDETGDWLDDVTRLLAACLYVLPIERPHATADFSAAMSGTELSVHLAQPPASALMQLALIEHASAFGRKHGDTHWQARLELALAARLLGLVPARLDGQRRKPEVALGLYAVGLAWLSRFTARLTRPAGIDSSRYPRRA